MMKNFLDRTDFGVLDCEEERRREINTERKIALRKGEAIGLEKGKEVGIEKTATEMLKENLDEN